MDQDFKYSNEEDRSYGLAGMAVSVVVWDSERLFNAVDIDAAAGEAMEMTQEFYFSGNPGLSSNVMCRLYVHRNTQIDAGLRRRMLDFAVEEGKESCSLDDDETLRLFDKCYTYCHRVFNHPGVQQVVRDFAGTLRARRRLTRAEVAEELRALSRM